MKPVRIAILDMYGNHPNEGMQGIKHIIEDQVFPNKWEIFNVRSENSLPSLDYDIFISSGGPGSPVVQNKLWDKGWIKLMNGIRDYNDENTTNKKYVFLICHSFQMLVHHWKYARVTKRKSTAFGIFPVHKTAAGNKESVLKNLPEPFYAVDSRDWQVVEPDKQKIKSEGAKILCLEKYRPHVPLERAIMGIRFTDEIIGFQFHPEADEFSMKQYFQREEKKKALIKEHGEKKFTQMMEFLKDPEKIQSTYNNVLPNFLKLSWMSLRDYRLSK